MFMASLVMLETVLSDLKMAHEQQKKSLEEEFEKLRLSLQVEKLLLLSKHIHLFSLMANVISPICCFCVLVMLMCSGSGGHTDVSEPQLERPSQAL